MKATTDDEKYTYVFALKDKHTLVFLQGDSAAITMIEGEPTVSDGTGFKHIG